MKKLKVFKNKRTISAIVSIALVVTAAIGITTAFYKDESTEVVNQFTVGNVTTELVEEFYQNPGSDTDFTKTPCVTNTGANDCLIRVRVSITPESVATKKVIVDDAQKSYLEIYADADKTQKFVYNGEWSNGLWEYRDGWYYYNAVVEPGDSTTPLFSTVVVNYDKDAEAGEANAWEDFDIILYQEAVQAEVFANGEPIRDLNSDGSNYDEIWAAYDGQTVGSNE